MVSFSCEVCNDTLVKKKLVGHFRQCPNAYFTCIDCNVTFQGNDFQKHTTCITEAEKYEGSMFRGNKKGQQQKPVAQKQQVEKKKEEIKPKLDSAKVEKSKSKKGAKSISDLLETGVSTDLYKVLKALTKDGDSTKKDVLKKLKLEKTEDGKVVLSL